MTDSISYDELFNRYENLKTLLHETTKQIDASFQNVTKLITDNTTNEKNDFLNAISVEIGEFRSQIQILFSNATSNDMDLYHPTRLEQKLQQLEIERIAGYQRVDDMQNQIQVMEEDKRRTQIELNKNAKLINEYQYQLSQTTDEPNIQPIDQNMDTFEDPNNQQQVQQLKKDNLDLRHLVDTLRATTQEYKNIALINDENAKHLLRADSKTNWESTDMDRFQREMQQEIRRQNKETLSRIADKQMRHLNTENVNVDEIINDDEKQPPKPRRPHSFRHGTVTDWDQGELNKLNLQMKQELKDLMMKDKQSKLEKQFAIQDRIRDSEYRASEVLGKQKTSDEHKYNVSNENGVVINMSMNMNINLNDNQSNQSGSDVERERIAMQNKLKQMAKSKVMDMSVRQMQTTDNSSSERMLINPEDRNAAQLELMQANKQKLLMKSDRFLQSAGVPEIKPEHKQLLVSLMMDIGILNESIQDGIWSEIEKCIQKSRHESVDLSDEASMDVDMSHVHSHQNSEIYHGGMSVTTVNAYEDKYLAFKEDVDLQMSQLRGNIQELNEENDNLKIHIQTLTDNQTRFNLEIEKYEKILEKERMKYEHLESTKFTLVESTSREIDSLRAMIVQVSGIFSKGNNENTALDQT